MIPKLRKCGMFSSTGFVNTIATGIDNTFGSNYALKEDNCNKKKNCHWYEDLHTNKHEDGGCRLTTSDAIQNAFKNAKTSRNSN